MVLEKKVIGPKVYFIDRDNKLLFSYGEVVKARHRYSVEKLKAVDKNG